MRVYIDLHIHSALSPCSDNEMTPNNIVNMAYLKGLDIIAVTDHNSAENVEAVSICAAGRGIIAVPGMELETREEVHLLCLFPGVAEALKMQETVYRALPEIENRSDIFGEQLLLDEIDQLKGLLKQMLLTATSLGVEEVFDQVSALGGVVIPAHVDREAYSILSNLGFIPENLNIQYIELSKKCCAERYMAGNKFLAGLRYIQSSDAHSLGDILERESYIDLEEVSIPGLLKALKG